MDALAVIISSIVFYVAFIEAVPPEACFANFRWDDCGHPPVPVMYYWKPGSRCEVGIWRGCLPSLNMFKSEYECVSTCIFTITPRPADWHEQYKGEIDYSGMDDLDMTTLDGETTTSESGSGTDGGGSGNTGATEDPSTVSSGDDSGTGSGGGSGTGTADDSMDATTTAAPVAPDAPDGR